MDKMKHFKYTYKESCAYHHEPPTSRGVQLYIQAESKN